MALVAPESLVQLWNGPALTAECPIGKHPAVDAFEAGLYGEHRCGVAGIPHRYIASDPHHHHFVKRITLFEVVGSDCGYEPTEYFDVKPVEEVGW